MAATAVTTFIAPLSEPNTYVFCTLFIWFTLLSAVLSFRIGKWISTAGAWARVLLFGFFTGSVLLYAAKNGFHGFGTPDFLPTYAAFIGVVPVMVFNYVGFELPSSAGDEMTNPQR